MSCKSGCIRRRIIPAIACFVAISGAILFLNGCSQSTTPPTRLPPINISASIAATSQPVSAAAPDPGNIAPQPSSPVASNSVTDIVSLAGPSVVMILTQRVNWSYYLQPVPQKGAGSGFIISPDGFIVTNLHVVEKAEIIKVHLADGRIFNAAIQGSDPFSDIAVIKINGQNLPVIAFGESKNLEIGQPVIAIGNAFALSGGYSVTSGIVSAKKRSIQIGDRPILHDLIQTDAAINPGNSGGPLVNLDGNVVGINTARIYDGQNVGFAVSSSTAAPVTEHLIKHGKIIWPWLGVDAFTLTPLIAGEINLPAIEGVVIVRVFNDGPGAKIGLMEKDIITALGEKPISSMVELQDELRKHRIGDTVSLKVARDGGIKTLTITLERTPERF